jgi:hypothetical protein
VTKASNADQFPDDEFVDERHRALVERLRGLRWPEPPPGVRERRLQELRDVLARGARKGATDPEAPPEG